MSGLAVAVCLCALPGAAQDPQDPQGPPPRELLQNPRSELEGLEVRSLTISGASSSEAVRRLLQTRVGEPLRASVIATDLQTLWKQQRYLVHEVRAARTEDGGVALEFLIDEPHSYDRVVFKGLRKLSEAEARDLIGLSLVRRITDSDAEEHQRILMERYRRMGNAFATVRVERDEEASTLTFVIDEGPSVTVREIFFRGNRAFPGNAPFNLYRNLIDGADIESEPQGWLLPGKPYSEDSVEDDLEKLRWFYRARGYRDADVLLAGVDFSDDMSKVDLTFRVIEGPRYRIRSVTLERIENGELDPEPLYPAAEVLERLRVKPGDFYDRDVINRDKREIEEFYGEKGHPRLYRYGRAPLQDAFQWAGDSWQQPRETFTPDSAEIDIVYQVVEGTPKTLRDVVIRGNTDTQDSIVRRKVQVFPGQRLDLTEIDRSVQLLNSLRYFQDPETLAGPRFELLPVEDDPDQVDLEIEVNEGDTGSFLWGAGVSTGAGVQARIQFSKRNFDLFRLPSSLSPGTLFSEVISNKAFHGAGQELELLLAPGTEISTFRLSFYEPDLFGDHIDTIGLRVQAFRSIRVLDSFDSDSRGLIVGLQRNFTENLSLGVSLRQETTEVEDLDGNAPAIVYDAEGQAEMRSWQVQATMRDLDNYVFPTEGYDLGATVEVAGGLLGGEEDFYKLRLSGQLYSTLLRDSLDRAHVLYLRQSFDFGHAYSNTDDLFLTERFYMGGSNLRGFDQRRAGPTQFGRPLGGEVRALARAEYQFPLVSTRLERSVREVELLRGVLFTDAGLLGTGIDDPTFSQLRASAGFGVRIHVPILGVPIALDFGFPLAYEETDDRQVFFFSLAAR